MIAQGVYDGVNWEISDNGELFIGSRTVEQQFTYRDVRYSYEYGWYDYGHEVLSVSFSLMGVKGNGSHAGMFSNCSSLTSLDLNYFDTSNITDMEAMFENCESLTSLDLSSFDTSNVTNMSGMFRVCQSLASLDLSNFNTFSVTDMSYMFYGCVNLISLDISYFNTSNVTDMRDMFDFCYLLTPLNLSSFDTSNVINMNYLFRGCQSLVSLDLSNFNTKKVKHMSNMFYDCRLLTSLDLSNFDTSNVTNMSYMFENCQSLTTLDLSNFDTSNVTDMRSMFNNCVKLTTTLNIMEMPTSYSEMCIAAATNSSSQLILRYFDPVTQNEAQLLANTADLTVSNIVIEFAGVAYAVYDTGDYSLTIFRDVSGRYHTGDIEIYYKHGVEKRKTYYAEIEDITGSTQPYWYDMNPNIKRVIIEDIFRPKTAYKMFSDMWDLFLIEGLEKIHTLNVTNMENMFYDCQSLASLDLNNFNTSNVTNMKKMFDYCSSLTSLDLRSFDTSNVTNMESMFDYCSSLASLDLRSFDTSNVTNMRDMFNGCESLISLNLSNFDTSNVTDMSGMFANCAKLTSLYLSNFNTSSVTDMRSMFHNNSELILLDLSSFNTTLVKHMEYMFHKCVKLETIYVSAEQNKWNVTNVTYSSSMFKDCFKIIGSYETTYDSSKTDKTYARIDSSSQKGYLSGYIKKGVYDGVDWLIDSKYRLFIGRIGEEQTFISRGSRSFSDWPWSSYYSGIKSVKFVGEVNGNGSHKYMFHRCRSLVSLDLSNNFNTSDVTNMSYMFSQCESLVSLDLNSFNTSGVIDMNHMFDYCKSLISLDLNSFNTLNVTNMSHMFSQCFALTSLDLSSFNTPNVKDMSHMFAWCYLLDSLDLSNNFKTSNVTNMACMFIDCSSLELLDLSSFDISNVINMDSMFRRCLIRIPIFYVSNYPKEEGTDIININVTNMFESFDGEVFLMRPENVTNPTEVKDFWREVAATNPKVHFEYDDTDAPTSTMIVSRGKFKDEFNPENTYYIHIKQNDSYERVLSPVEENLVDYYYKISEEGEPPVYVKVISDDDFIEDDNEGNVIKIIPNISIKQNNIPDKTKVGPNILTNIELLLKKDGIEYSNYTVAPHEEGSLDLKKLDIDEVSINNAFYIILEKSNSEKQYSLETILFDRREDVSFPFKIIIPGIFAMIEFRKGGHGMSIGKVCERDGLEVSIPTAIGEGLLLPTTTNSNNEEVIDLTKDQLVIGRYNIKDNETNPDKQKAFIIGNGADDNGTITRSNALTIDWQGNISIPTGHIDTIDMTTTEISNFIAELNVSGAPINTTQDDWVVEQGMSGIWTYRKWQSGTVDCLFGSTTITGSTGALYLYRAGNIVFLSSNGAFRSSSSSIATATKLSQTIPSGFRPIAKAYNMSVSATKNWRLEIASTGDIYFYGDTAWNSGLYLSGVWVTNDNISV